MLSFLVKLKNFFFIKVILFFIFFFLDLLFFPIIFIFAIIGRYKKKKISIGIGPEPLINSYYHKKALQLINLRSESFTFYSWYNFNKFDYIIYNRISPVFAIFYPYILFIRCLLKYDILLMSFKGGSLKSTCFFFLLEPLILKISKIKVVILPYGSDVFTLQEVPTIIYKKKYLLEYPNIIYRSYITLLKKKLWYYFADYIVSGQDWVFYTKKWDRLILTHVCHDYIKKNKIKNKTKNKIFRILHAPTHKNIKGTTYIKKAITKLQNEGYKIKLDLVTNRINKIVLKHIEKADLVIDQLIVGFYSMFTIEAISRSKAVIVYMNKRLINFYKKKKMLNPEEPPMINANHRNIYSVLKNVIILEKKEFKKIGNDSYKYYLKYHHIKNISKEFLNIIKELNYEYKK